MNLQGWVTDMSYDLRLAVKVEGAKDLYAVIATPEYSSPTYNLRDMFVACMDWNYKQGEWYNVAEVLPKIYRGIQELELHSEKYEKYNPPNGWGSISSALEALNSLKECILKNASGNYWSWNEIPYELMYMSW